MKYRKKPVVIEAIFWDETKSTYESLLKMGMEMMTCTGNVNRPDVVDNLRIKTLKGTMTVNKGDWIIKGIHGEFYPCQQDIFEATYELVEETKP